MAGTPNESFGFNICLEAFSRLKNSLLIRLKTRPFYSKMSPYTFVTSKSPTPFWFQGI